MGAKTSVDLTILPLLSTLEDLGMNTILLLAKDAGMVPPSSTCFYALNRTCKLSLPAHLQKAVRNTSWAWSEFLVCSQEFVKLTSVGSQRMTSLAF